MNTKKQQTFKRYMTENDFEIDYHIDSSYHSIAPEYHEFYELFFFVNGNVDFIVDNQLYHMQKGDFLFIPPNTFHNPIFHNFDIPYERYILWVSVSTMNRLIELDSDIGYFMNEKAPKVHLFRNPGSTWSNFNSSFHSLLQYSIEKKLCYKSEGLSIIIYMLLQYNKALYYKNQNIIGGTNNTLLTNILHYIQTNITEDLSLDKISSEFYINKFHISRLFKNDLKISYYQYVIQKRLNVGKENILAGVPVNKVHETCGFSDYICFYRAFKKEYGVAPSKFKQLHAEKMSFL
jgi:AraC-like DNA-binding protein